MITDPQTKKLIEGLNLAGYAVLLINDELFIITSFTDAEGIVNKHILIGKEITNINSNHLLPSLASTRQDQTNKQVVTYIQNLPNVKREFHHAITWTTFIPA